MNKIEIYFESEGRKYRIRAIDSLNLVIEEYRLVQKRAGGSQMEWVGDGNYYGPQGIQRGIMELVTRDIQGDLKTLFEEQNRRLAHIEKMITTQFESKQRIKKGKHKVKVIEVCKWCSRQKIQVWLTSKLFTVD